MLLPAKYSDHHIRSELHHQSTAQPGPHSVFLKVSFGLRGYYLSNAPQGFELNPLIPGSLE